MASKRSTANLVGAIGYSSECWNAAAAVSVRCDREADFLQISELPAAAGWLPPAWHSSTAN
jgi:hypothetical protein